MNNPLEILTTFDHHLQKPTELTVFGRAALVLGYPNPPPEYGATQDVDGIIPVTAGDPDAHFWAAQQATNETLKNRGLYITHLFSELDVILQPDWLGRRVALNLDLARLCVFRPATIDLILTKMARADEQDLADIRFLLSREPIRADALQRAFGVARVPDVPEIQELFRSAQPKVLALATNSP
jgi:hypothetical protein